MERSQGFLVKARVFSAHVHSKPAPGLHNPGGVPEASSTLLISENTKPLRASSGTEGMTRGDPKCPPPQNLNPFHKNIHLGEKANLQSSIASSLWFFLDMHV